MKKKLALMLALSLTVGTVLTGCGGASGDAAQTTADNTQTADESDAADTADTANADLVYAVEAGSAGEAAAQDNGFQTNVVASQADALMEVASGTSDAAIIDLLMAGAMIGEGTSYPNMKYTDELTTEEYGVGCRKGSDLASYINSVFAESYADGSMKEMATTYGVQEALVEQPDSEFSASAEDSDVAYIQDKGTMIVGITDFAPMDYKDASGEWIGFDADMARLVAEKLGVEAQFVEIDWDNKIMELESKNIDVVWNGMTLTAETTSAMECTNPYCNNAQVIVVPAN
ncbi:MAG: transporter substrate-binding domain-containing protein [Lachnospiraceae bacterium]|nr:transporter substrate-binding domain-containing protein [Lachnospiraceae bacterium]